MQQKIEYTHAIDRDIENERIIFEDKPFRRKYGWDDPHAVIPGHHKDAGIQPHNSREIPQKALNLIDDYADQPFHVLICGGGAGGEASMLTERYPQSIIHNVALSPHNPELAFVDAPSDDNHARNDTHFSSIKKRLRDLAGTHGEETIQYRANMHCTNPDHLLSLESAIGEKFFRPRRIVDKQFITPQLATSEIIPKGQYDVLYDNKGAVTYALAAAMEYETLDEKQATRNILSFMSDRGIAMFLETDYTMRDLLLSEKGDDVAAVAIDKLAVLAKRNSPLGKRLYQYNPNLFIQREMFVPVQREELCKNFSPPDQ